MLYDKSAEYIKSLKFFSGMGIIKKNVYVKWDQEV